MKVNGIKKILVIRTDRLGDVVLTLPVFTALRKKFPESYLAFLVRPYVKDVVTGNPDIDEIIYDNGNNFWELVKKLRKDSFDLAIVVHPTFQLALLVYLAGIKYRIGTGFRLYSLFFNIKVYHHRKESKKHELEYNFDLLQPLKIELEKINFKIDIPEIVRLHLDKILSEAGILKSYKFVIMHPGSGGSGREWSPKKFSRLSELLLRESDIKIVFTGINSEKKLIDSIIDSIPENLRKGNVFDFSGKLTIKELAELTRRCSLFISSGTGPLHLAVAVGSEVIGFFPPIATISSVRWGPYGKSDSVVMPPGIEMGCKKCAGQKGTFCECMELITPETVFESAIKKITKVQN